MRPITTLFMLQSLDGKISTSESDDFDFDTDLPLIDGVKDGLHQYYEIEQTTDLCSINTGRVMAKIGVNERDDYPKKSPCTFVIIDNRPHLTEKGITYLSKWLTQLIIVTTNKNHKAFSVKDNFNNVNIEYYTELNLAKSATIQSGGNMNELFLRNNLIDYVNIVVAPILIGGKNVSTLIDGNAIRTRKELDKLKSLKLIECKTLKNSYIQLKYAVRK